MTSHSYHKSPTAGYLNLPLFKFQLIKRILNTFDKQDSVPSIAIQSWQTLSKPFIHSSPASSPTVCSQLISQKHSLPIPKRTIPFTSDLGRHISISFMRIICFSPQN